MTSCRLISLVLSAALCGVLSGAGPARAAAPGTIFVTEQKPDTSGPDFEKQLRAQSRTTLKKSGDSWHPYFVAFLKKPPGADEVFVVFYDTAVAKHEPVNNYQLRTSAKAKILEADVEIKPEDGFKAGHKYQMLITRLIGGHEEVYARTTLELL